MKLGEALNIGNNILKEKNIDTYLLDTKLLMMKVINCDKLYLLTHRDAELSKEALDKYLQLIYKRAERYPLQYLTEKCEFMSLPFKISEGVLIPRPDTEILVEEAINNIREKGFNKICDVCSGSGIIGLSIAYYTLCNVTCLDISEDALKLSVENCKELKLSERVSILKSDLLEEPISKGEKYQMILSNPPYIKESEIPNLMQEVALYEPRLALTGGQDGLFFYKKLACTAKEALIKGGMLCFEIGYDQKQSVFNILEEEGFTDLKCIKDLSLNDRVVTAVWQ